MRRDSASCLIAAPSGKELGAGGGSGRVVEHLGSARPRFQFLICHSLEAVCAGAKHGILPGP